MANKKKRVLVTGGEGLIGSLLVEKLINLGYVVGSLDAYLNFADNNKYYRHCLAIRQKHFKQASKKYNIDIREKRKLEKAFEDFQPDYVIHLAAISLARVSEKHESKMIPINMQGTFNVLEAFERSSAQKIIYTSSSMAYGHFKQTPQSEEFLLDPVNSYGATKAAGEYFVKLSKKEWVIVRPTSVYGFADCANRVTQVLIDAAHGKRSAWIAKGEKLDFTYVEDVVDGFIKLLESPKALFDTYNISRGEARSIEEYAEILKGYFPKFEYEVRKPLTEIPWRGPLDIHKARRFLGFRPQYSIEDGIEETLKLVKKYDFYNY